MRPYQKFALVFFWFLFCFSNSYATSSHCLTLYDPCKYARDFTHFEYTNASAPKGGAVKLAETGSFDTLNAFALKGVKAPGLNYLFDSLMVQSLDEPMAMYGLVAESVELAADSPSAEFTLRPQARWHDGTPITPDDIVFSFHALKEKGDPVYHIMFAPIIACEKTGARKVKFTFSDTKNKQLPMVAASMPILSKAYYASHDFEKTTLESPLASGPYKVESVDQGRSIVYKRVADYWAKDLPVNKGQFNFDTIRYDMYRDENVTLEALKAGQYDFRREYIARNWATAYDAPAVKDGRITKREIPDGTPQGMQAFIFNVRNSKFADRRVREAIERALDYEWVNKTIFYGAYARNGSFFENTDFAATSLPSEDELALLNPFSCHPERSEAKSKDLKTLRQAQGDNYCLPPALFTQTFANPKTDGSGNPRDSLLIAQKLLNDAGCTLNEDGKRVTPDGTPITVEFLLRQPTMERVIGPMRKNLERLGITASIRMVDDSQYQKRTDAHDFDIISIWINRGLFYPGNEQMALWHSSQADVKGGNNLSGTKNPAIDAVLAALLSAKNKRELVAAGRALDRILLWEHYVIPNWHSGSFRVAYWDKFAMPQTLPKYGLGFDSWWIK